MCTGNSTEQPDADLTLNYKAITCQTGYTPVQMRVIPGQKQFWRIANTNADQEMKLSFENSAGVRQKMTIVAIDGLAVGKQQKQHEILCDSCVGSGQKVKAFDVTEYILTTAGRVEIIVTMPTVVQGEYTLYTNKQTNDEGTVGLS